MTGQPGSMTAMLHAARGGDRQALDGLFQHMYGELRRLASRVRGRQAGQTLCTTALVHEAYLKLVRSAELDWRGRAHFFGIAARAMRQVVVDAARQREREKRGGSDRCTVTFDEAEHATPVSDAELLALDEALDRLAQLDERQARVVEQRFFAGLTVTETAAVLDVSEATVHRDWRAARAWLRGQLSAQEILGGR
ncbi:MAG TPA: ECF-type sigma factor [Longimicrobiales bacterium]